MTTEVERRLADCRKDGAKALLLDAMGLIDLPPAVRELTTLQKLSLQHNELTNLPSWIGELTHLRYLHLNFNPLRTLPPDLERLANLQHLFLVNALPSAAVEAIGNLPRLRYLVLANLGLETVPGWIRRLQNLRFLYLQGNDLKELPEWLTELKALESLAVGDNPKLNIPTEIVRSQDALKILQYYARTARHRAEPLNEFKLVLVGRGGVGKTTLVHRLVTSKYNAEFPRTAGIDIRRWATKIDGQDVRAHIWDFGGQEIQHGTHRFFMTERALYMILISGREGTEDHDADYWLSLVRSFAGQVPIIVLLHKWEDFHFELNRELLREKYGAGLFFIETDSKSNHGIAQLRDEIRRHATKLPGLHATWPQEWRRIKDELPTQEKSWLTFGAFRSFCAERGVDNPGEQEALAESLHDLGLMLSYRHEEALREFGVLNPQWATKGIYEMLNSRELKEAGGRFDVGHFARVLSNKEYPTELHPFMLALMRKFRLCHPLDDKGKDHLIPELLTKEEPKLDADFPAAECLGFIYRYDAVLPEGLLPRFIVETYVRRGPKHVWRTGVVLERANCRALVRGDVQGRTIAIRVTGSGNGRRELLGIIREHFERIHRSYEKLPVTELVPMFGNPSVCVPYSDLLAYEAAGEDDCRVVVEGKLQKVGVKTLLDGVDLPGATRGVATAASPPTAEFTAFISYSHKDAIFFDQLKEALMPYERLSELRTWSDVLIEPGRTWDAEIFSHLDRADIVLLLLSPAFLNSSYVEKELKRALERRAKGECEIVPIVVRACRADKLPIWDIQAIIPGGQPIDEHEKKDPAWVIVTKELDRVLARLRKARAQLQPP